MSIMPSKKEHFEQMLKETGLYKKWNVFSKPGFRDEIHDAQGNFIAYLDDVVDYDLEEEIRNMINNIKTVSGPNDDLVNHPSHYTNGTIECIDAIQASMPKYEFVGYLRGNIMKYLWRFDKKERALQDLKKASWYLTKLVKLFEEEDHADKDQRNT